ncbi:capsular biosynthesis protein [Cohnella kolymensis]|uniref:non-specific protein-tyrosine kinase n=1 Tax=Cohnella kolymensis TaxID=1590652 RepID=A0ABR5A358_9BACL|nr:CpsD/CapB family tyrosine-protein kinase [Cohnella kolymensis]KIL35377.1 capsular biosynthesis protein [Cohnella kolymensis]
MSKPILRTKKRHIIVHNNPKSPVSEAYRSLRTNIQFSSVDTRIQTIMVTSASPGEGKSTTAINLAATYAQAEHKVLLIDADLRKPSIHHTFLCSNRFGLTNWLTNSRPVSEVVVKTFVPNLYLLPSGAIAPNPSELLSSKKMSKLLEELKQEFDIIILDSPPVLAVTDAQIIASISDGVVMVADSGKVKIATAQKAKEKLEHVNAKILGVAINNIKRSSHDDYYYYYGET